MIGMIAALNLLFPSSSQASRYVRIAFLVIRGKGGLSFLLLLACFRHLLISSSRPRFLSSPTLLWHTSVTSQIQHSTRTQIWNFRRPEEVPVTKALLLFLRVSAWNMHNKCRFLMLMRIETSSTPIVRTQLCERRRLFVRTT